MVGKRESVCMCGRTVYPSLGHDAQIGVAHEFQPDVVEAMSCLKKERKKKQKWLADDDLVSQSVFAVVPRRAPPPPSLL